MYGNIQQTAGYNIRSCKQCGTLEATNGILRLSYGSRLMRWACRLPPFDPKEQLFFWETLAQLSLPKRILLMVGLGSGITYCNKEEHGCGRRLRVNTTTCHGWFELSSEKLDGSYNRPVAPTISGSGWVLVCTRQRKMIRGSFYECSPSASSYRGKLLGLTAIV